jgi:putative SOS response-associated peptidase YedK
MKDGSPFGLGGLWENWKDPKSGEWIRTFTIITTDANELVAHMLLLAPGDYVRWLGDEPDPRDLMRRFGTEASPTQDPQAGSADVEQSDRHNGQRRNAEGAAR